jgi:lysyl-tRNA synthetase class II
MDPSIAERFRTRAKIIQTIRDFLNELDFIEVENTSPATSLWWRISKTI